MNDEQSFLSRLFLVFNRLFCSHGSRSVSLQLPIFSVIPSSSLISEMCTLLLLRKSGRLVPLLHVPLVLGLNKEIAALMVNEGAIFHLCQITGWERSALRLSLQEEARTQVEVPHCLSLMHDVVCSIS